MLTLPIKKKWFDMILSGEKKEEYREIKPYYTSRFSHVMNDADGKPFEVVFRNGYSSTSRQFKALVGLDVKTGNPDWGAEPNKPYYVLTIREIYDDGTV